MYPLTQNLSTVIIISLNFYENRRVTIEFCSQMTKNAERASISWRHHEFTGYDVHGGTPISLYSSWFTEAMGRNNVLSGMTNRNEKLM